MAAPSSKSRVTVWESAGPAVDLERQRGLLVMSDREAQDAFARLLALWQPPEHPPATSGLIELQRFLARHYRQR